MEGTRSSRSRAKAKNENEAPSHDKPLDDLNGASEETVIDKPEESTDITEIVEDEADADTNTKKRKASEHEEDGERKRVPETTEAVEENKVDYPTSVSEQILEDMTSIIESDYGEKVSDEALTDSDINMPPKQTLGKGKRARIPNKRYSDILLSPTQKSPAYSKVENGSDTDELTITPIIDRKPRNSTNSPNTMQKRGKTTPDLSNPAYLKPFEFGWKRELVWRGVFDASNPAKRSGDIYYYTPQGKKVRSLREVAENIKGKDLTSANFSFAKESLGLDDPEREIIREAKYKTGPSLQKKVVAKGTPPPAKAKEAASPKVASPKASAPKVDAEEPKTKGGKQNAKNLGNIKIKLPGRKGEKRKSEEEQEPEPQAKPTPTTTTRRNAKWSKANNEASPNRPKRRSAARNQNTPSLLDKLKEMKPMDHYLQNLSYGYTTLLHVFQYLKVQDLLRSGCVCTMWRDIASHPLLWRTVRMKNSQVHSFEGLANTLKKHGTNHLDLRKMLLPSGGDEIWPEFSEVIERVDTLRKIELCRCPASVVEKLAASNPHLEVLNAVTIKCESMCLDQLVNLRIIKELRLKSTNGLSLTSDINSLRTLITLKHLSLTSIKDLHKANLSVLSELTGLESLDLGECNEFPKNFGSDILIKLTKLEKLRLEKGQGECHTFDILEAVQKMPQLEQLELVNFDIKQGFDSALGACSSIKKLLVIPTYISQSATTNHMVLGGVLRLHKTLSHFVWGVTLELLRVTELFVDQCEEPANKEKKDKKPTGNGDSIPVLKPVPVITESNTDIPPAFDPPQVEILPLPNLQKLLLQSLPTTRVKILKIPFHATWRQSITDTVN